MRLVSLDSMFGRRAANDSQQRPVVGEAYDVQGKKMICTAAGLKFFYVVPEHVWDREVSKPANKRNYGNQLFINIREVVDRRVKKWTGQPAVPVAIAELDNLADPEVSPVANGPVNDVALRAALIKDMEERMKGLDLRPVDPTGEDGLRAKLMQDLGVKPEEAASASRPMRPEEILKSTYETISRHADAPDPTATKEVAKKKRAPRKTAVPAAKKTLIKRKPKMENVVATL